MADDKQSALDFLIAALRSRRRKQPQEDLEQIPKSVQFEVRPPSDYGAHQQLVPIPNYPVK